MSAVVRLFAVLAALLIAAPSGAVPPTGSAGWTSDGWTTFSGTLYAGPGELYDEIGTVDADVRVRVDRCNQRWCQIRTGNARGWISLYNLSFGQAPDGWISGPEFGFQRGGSGQVCFYTGTDFTGESFCAPSGRVIRDLAFIDRDNTIRSIEVGDGVSTIVCRDRGFRSYCLVVNESQKSLEGLLSNSISSIRVY
jgi:hypothetical protein